MLVEWYYADRSSSTELTKLRTTRTHLRSDIGGEDCRIGEEEEVISDHSRDHGSQSGQGIVLDPNSCTARMRLYGG